MLTLKGFSAWITIEGVGKEAKEYDVQAKDVSGRAEISCFIASEVGQVCHAFLIQSLSKKVDSWTSLTLPV